MNGSPTLGKTSGTTDAHIPIPRLPQTSGTVRSSIDHIMSHTSIAVPASVVVAETESIVQNAYIMAYHRQNAWLRLLHDLTNPFVKAI